MMTKYGIPKSKDSYPVLELIHDTSDPVQGEFRDESDEIIVNMAQCETIRDAIETMVHEYQHYLIYREGPVELVTGMIAISIWVTTTRTILTRYRQKI